MALLDLQAMEAETVELGFGSASSHHSCDASELSVTLCEGHSYLSALAC